MRYRDLIQRSAELTGADPAIVAALMEVEGSGEGSVSPAGAMGLMQLMPDKFRPGDDPFDPPTNLLRAAQHIRLLQDRWKSAELVAAAYFGAIDSQGNVTGASDGNIDGFGYVEFFRAAYRRYVDGLAPLPLWLVSPFGDLSLTSDMIKFGFLGDYGHALAHAIRGEHGVAQYGTSHLGLDLQIPGRPDGGRGAPVVAPFEGRVIRTSDPIGGPFGIWLESPKLNLRARLMHMDGLVKGIETGLEVKAGQQLGILGAQGTEGFPHLHLAFERLSDGQKINPALFYRLKDATDPGTMTGRWYEGLPDRAPSLPAGGPDTRMIPVGEGQPAALEPIRPVGIYVAGDFNEVALERFSVEALVPSDSDDSSAAEPTWRTLLEEAFANNGRGWPNQPGSTAWLDEGAYRLFARQPDRFVTVSAPMADLLSDVLVSGTFRKLGGPPGGNYGLVLRDQGPSSRDGLNQSGRYYVFVVRDDGEVGIYRRETDRWITVQPWTPSEVVHLNGESNDLAVRALGPRLTFIVNGTEVATVIYRETAPLASRWGPFQVAIP
jgi:murein DD-endopeptidase MepM/ murein hydrolase activator NlpD